VSARAALVAIAVLAAPAALPQAEPTDPIEEAGRINARLAMEYLKREQLQVAQDKIEKALAQNPKDVNVQLAAGLVYERLHENRTAEKHFRQAVRISPDSPEAQNALGAYFCRNEQQKKGEEMFLKAAANPLYRTPFVAYTNAGVCARSAGNLEQAERYLRQALTSRVDYPETYAQLAGVLHGRGNNLHARAFVERYLAVAPATPEMLLLGYNIEVAMKDEAAAAAFKARLEKEFPDSEQLRRVQSAPARTSG
jgi:type IV pilus assembly protein PilF